MIEELVVVDREPRLWDHLRSGCRNAWGMRPREPASTRLAWRIVR